MAPEATAVPTPGSRISLLELELALEFDQLRLELIRGIGLDGLRFFGRERGSKENGRRESNRYLPT